jgi:putative PIN family toxin of toxin-antitoxin system
MRLVLDTNVLVSAFLWQGVPGRLIELAIKQDIQLLTSRVLLDELADVLPRKKLAKKVTATGLTPAQIVLNYRRLAQLVTARKLSQAISRDADDDHVLACAIAAQADLIVSGDEHLSRASAYGGLSKAIFSIRAGSAISNGNRYTVR